MSFAPPRAEPRSALRQSALVLFAVVVLWTAFSTSLESQRSVARLASSSAVADTTAPASCAAR
jgi:hypothetical protein